MKVRSSLLTLFIALAAAPLRVLRRISRWGGSPAFC